MVGVSSYIPAFQNSLRKLFGDIKVKVHQRPMTAIAEGAAILAQKLAGQAPELMGEVLYRSAHDYYLKLANGDYLSLVEKQTPLPIKVIKNLKYEEASQLVGHFSFFSKDEGKADGYGAIGDLWLSHIPERIGLSGDDSAPEVEMEFTLTEDELVHVAARLKDNPAVSISKTITRGREDESLFHELIAAIQEINNQQDSIKRFNFLYHSAALAQGISESFLQIDKLNAQSIAQKVEKIKNKLNLIIKSIEESETSNMWNDLLKMYNLYDFGIGMGKLKGEEAKNCLKQITDTRARLLSFESLDDVKNTVEESLSYVNDICPNEVKQRLYYSSAQDNSKSGMGKVGTGLKI
jgi:molecular chaperone DnaK (HSP70)